MRKTILTLILILTTSLVSFSQLTYKDNNTIKEINLSLGDSIKINKNHTLDSIRIIGQTVSYTQLNFVTFTDTLLSVPGDFTMRVILPMTEPSPLIIVHIHVIDNTASIKDKEIEISELIAYPNPTVGDIHLAFNTNNIKTPIFIYSLNGQLVYHDNDNRQIGTNRFELNTSNFASGLYIIKVGNETFKFVKIRQ